MHLKSLELMGFKSFGRKTVFDFQPGVTAIIGPNGSGKSNVCDAIRWVLGEQSAKALRGTKMSEVIFAGSPQLRPSAYSQVKLVLDNEDRTMDMDFSEVSIGRQLFRSGESNYYVNNTRSLLSNIKEMLMDTGIGKDGYSVIGQGDIDDIIFQRTQSRRALIEEAAGITKFKHRKNNTLNKLSHTRSNITRLNDIINEIEGQLGPLAEQAEKTKKYQALAAEIRQLEIDLVLFDLNQLYSKQENIDSMRSGLLAKIEEIEKFLAEVDVKKAAAREKFAEFEAVLQARQGEVKVVVDKIENERQNSSAAREEIRSHQARSQAIVEEMENIDSMLKDGGDEIDEAQARLKEETEQEGLIRENIDKVSKEAELVDQELQNYLKEQAQDKESAFQMAVQMTDRKNKITTASQQISILDRQLEKGSTDITSLEGQVEKLSKEKSRLEEEIETMKTEVNENKTQLSEEMTRLNKVERTYKSTEEELISIGDQVKIFRARSNILEEIKHSREGGIYRGVQAALALKQTGRLPNIFGIVGDLITVPKGYETAFETALGGSIQDVVTKDAETAKRAIGVLKQNRAGRATFLPMDMIKAPPKAESPNARGCLGVALDLVEYDARFYTIMSYLLGRILIFETLDDATEFARRNRNFSRIVTLEGDVVRSSGAMTGGGDNKKGGGILTRKREQEELENKLKGLEAKERKLKSSIGILQKERHDLLVSTRNRQDAVSRREQSIEFFEKSLEKNASELEIKSDEFKNIENDRNEMKDKLSELKTEMENAQKELIKLESQNTELTERLGSLSGKAESIQTRLNSLNTELSEKKLRLAQIEERKKAVKKEIEMAVKRREEAQERKNKASQEVERLKQAVAEGEKTVDEIQKRINAFEEEKTGLENAMQSLQDEYRKMSKEVDQLDHAYQSRIRIEDSTRKKLSELDIKLAEVKTNITNKEGILRGEFNLAVNEVAFNLHKYESRDELANRITQRKFEQEALEPVNPLAIEDYEKTKERYEFLNSQVDDMTEAATSLEEVIAEIEKISSERFVETFEQINLAFGDIFEILFPGGNGFLKLSDKNEPLTSNVEIKCKLPDKKLSTIELFSGGEKSLISLALLFAILQVKPPAFCLLDEVEAALDEANVRRFTRLLRSFADKTQFLVITHNKETMQAVDVIYGVTLQKNGVSRPISIRLEDEDKIKEFTVSRSGGVSKKRERSANPAMTSEENA